MMQSRWTLLALCGLTLAATTANAQTPRPEDPRANETKAQRDVRMKWWREARFGMFIHWGVYSVPAGVYDGKNIGGIGEWIMRSANIPVQVYQDYAKQFNPVKFNADEWVSYAKAAGMKYIVMTAKHHDGFCMYPTAVDDWNITGRSEFKRDPVGEMSAACKKAGIKFGVYYSQNLDWNHPGGGTAGKMWDDRQKGDFHEYVRKVSAPQVNELLTRYNPAVLWWDINGPFTPEEVRLLTASFPKVPGLISNNRLGGGIPGDTETPEQFIPATGFKDRDWETCMTINDTWGYKSTDHNFKTTSLLLRNLIDIASKGGNYLLNVGPDSLGVIPGPEVQRLKEMGQWLNKNGKSVYGSSSSPYKRLPFNGRATVNGNHLYLNIFEWPAAGLEVPGLQNRVMGAQAVDGGQKLQVSRLANGSYKISKPAKMNDISTAIMLTLDGAPRVVEPEVLINAGKDGAFQLIAEDAVVVGSQLKAEGGRKGNLGWWMSASDHPMWNLSSSAGGKFAVSLEVACEPGTGGSTFDLFVNGKKSGVGGTVEETKSWNDYKVVKLDGVLQLTGGKNTIDLRISKKPGFAVMNLRRVILTGAPN